MDGFGFRRLHPSVTLVYILSGLASTPRTIAFATGADNPRQLNGFRISRAVGKAHGARIAVTNPSNHRGALIRNVLA
jgi:hypothetical protein